MPGLYKDMKSEKLPGLAAWKVDLEAPPRFQAEVWARIAARESSRCPVWATLDAWVSRLAAVLNQPQFAAATVAVGLLLGIGTAYLKAQDSNALASQQLEIQYFKKINPLAHASHSS